MFKSRFFFIVCLFVLGLGLSANLGAQTNQQPECLDSIGVEELVSYQPELTGKTVNMAMVELSQPNQSDPDGYAFLPNFAHQALINVDWRGLYCYQNPHRPVVCSDHATRIAGILFGYDLWAEYEGLGIFEFRGIIPQAKLDLFETNWFIYKHVLAGDRDPLDNDVVSISWGTDADDAITMWWQRGIDAMVEREGLVVTAASGNGSDEFNSICKPSWGYNVICVGAARSLGTFPDSLSYLGAPVQEYSNFGPTEDGRCKPDIIAGGFCLAPSSLSLDAYSYGSSSVGYSSFAAPQVAGVAALLIDAARQNDIKQAEDDRLVKALLLNGANKLQGWHKGKCTPEDDHHVPLDYRQGAGLVNAWNSYEQLAGGRLVSSVLPLDPNHGPFSAEQDGFDQDEAVPNLGWDVREVSLNPTDPNSLILYYLPELLEEGDWFTATLCWHQHYQQLGIFAPLSLSNLILELWSVNDAGEFLERLDYSDSLYDNLQHIHYQSAARQRVALLVIGGESQVSELLADSNDLNRNFPVLPKEKYGLAVRSQQENWPGDQLSADLDADGIVGVQDLLQLLGAWWERRESEGLLEAFFRVEDINGDGRIDGLDFNEMAQQWQQRSVWCTK